MWPLVTVQEFCARSCTVLHALVVRVSHDVVAFGLPGTVSEFCARSCTVLRSLRAVLSLHQ